MQKIIRHAVMGLVCIATYAIIVHLSMELADSQPVMLALLLLSAFVASVGLVYARQSFRGKDWSVGSAALAVTFIATLFSVIGDISYWSGTLDTVHEEVLRDKAIREGQDLVIARQKTRYSSLSNGESAEQLQAAMAGALAKPIGDKTLGARTKDCTDTASYHYRSCTEYFNLKAKFAAANEAQKLESVVWAAGTHVEKSGRRRDFYRAAVAISDATGWTVEHSILGITSVIVILLQSLMMLSLYIGLSPERRTEASAALKSPKAMDIAPMPITPALARVARSESLIRDDLGRKQAEALGEPGTGSGGGGSPSFPQPLVEKVASPVAEVEAPLPSVPRIIVNNDRDDDDRGRFQKKPRSKKKEGKVSSWLADCTTQTDDPSVKATSIECRKSYEAWCKEYELLALPPKTMARQIGVIIGRATGRDGRKSRNGQCSTYPGLIVADTQQFQRRRTA